MQQKTLPLQAPILTKKYVDVDRLMTLVPRDVLVARLIPKYTGEAFQKVLNLMHNSVSDEVFEVRVRNVNKSNDQSKTKMFTPSLLNLL